MLATPEDKRLVEAIEALTKQTFKPISISPMPRTRRGSGAPYRRDDRSSYAERVDTPEDERLARERARAYMPPAQRHRDPIFDMPYLENPRATSSAQKADAALLGGRGR